MLLETDPDLPEYFHEQDQRAAEAHDTRLSALGVSIGKLRDEAVRERAGSGIEAIWMACEEAYLAIDPKNRGESSNGTKFSKPTSMTGPLTVEGKGSPVGEVKSTAYVRLTTRYVDMGAAKVSEILLPINDKPFSFDPTPVPELLAHMEDPTPVQPAGMPPGAMAPIPQAAAMAAGGMPGMPAGPEGAPAAPTVGDQVKALMAKASESAEKAETRIHDWMIESNYGAEMRKVIHDAARIGTGVLKGPFPDQRDSQAITRIPGGGIQLERISRTVPAFRQIDPWNFFPHHACGECIDHGNYVLERDFLSSAQIRALRGLKDIDGTPVYLSKQIDRVLLEGPGKCNVLEHGRNPNEQKNNGRFTVWYFTGTLTREEVALTNAVGLDDLPIEQREVFAIVTLVNDTVIRATINPLQSGEFNYHVMPWSRRAGSWAGVGVGEQVSMAQRTVNAASRRLFDNAGNSSGPQHIINRLGIEPADGQWRITPDKIWYAKEDVLDVTKAFMSVNLPNIGPQLMAIIEYGFKLAEEACNIPLISQGQAGPTTPDTFGAAELQNNNANTLLRSIGYSFDDHITVRVVRQSYEWLLLDPDVPDDEKGDFKINARGSSALVEKAIQEQTWIRLLGVAINPAYGMDPEMVAEQVLISKRLDPRKVQLSDEKKQQLAQAAQNAPPPPQIQVAQIREKGATDRLNMELQAEAQGIGSAPGTPDTSLQVATVRSNTDLQKAKLNQDADIAELRFKADQAEIDRQFQREMKDRDFQIKLMEFAQAKDMSLNDAKLELAKVSMELSTQKELSSAALAAGNAKKPSSSPQVAEPPSEPAGRAEPGQAFAQ